MPEQLPDQSRYFIEGLYPISADVPGVCDVLGMYLLDLMKAQGYKPVSGVSVELPEPESTPYPEGWCVVRVVVDVEEFDSLVEMDGL